MTESQFRKLKLQTNHPTTEDRTGRLTVRGTAGRKLQVRGPHHKLAERDIQKQVRDWLEAHGWFVERRQSGVYRGKGNTYIRVGEDGTADLLAMRLEFSGTAIVSAIFIETKTPKGKLRASQVFWKLRVEKHGFTYLKVTGIEDLERQMRSLRLPV